MAVYLPIAELAVNPLICIGLGALIGVLSGMFGVGGGFLMTPILLFYGIPPPVAVGTEAMHIAGSSVSSVIAHMRKNSVDVRLGLILIAGGACGAFTGVRLFSAAMKLGIIDLLVSVGYIFFLGAIGMLMLVESILFVFMRQRKADSEETATAKPVRTKKTTRTLPFPKALPLRMHFPQSKRRFSVIIPLSLGFFVGILSSMMGVGGGFFMVPALIYFLSIPTLTAIGTSLFNVTFVATFSAFLHATQNFTVDAVLGILLLIGGVFGAQLGVRIGLRFKAEELRILLALLVLSVCAKLSLDVFLPPEVPYMLTEISH